MLSCCGVVLCVIGQNMDMDMDTYGVVSGYAAILGVVSFWLALFCFLLLNSMSIFHLKQYFINIRINSGQLYVNYHIGPTFLS